LDGNPSQDRKCGQNGGYEENEYRVRGHASGTTPDRIPNVLRRTTKVFGLDWGTGRQTEEKMALVVIDFESQTQWALVAMPAPILLGAGPFPASRLRAWRMGLGNSRVIKIKQAG